jgi:carboxyl-terminal processing protease
MKSKSIYTPILLAAVLVAGIFIGAKLNFPISKASFSKNDSRSKINKLIELIDTEYVDAVNTDSIVDLTLTNILDQLDPHSVYVPPSEQVAIAEIMRGDFVGIGVSFYMYKDTIAVIQPIENGPSAKAGIISGDRILYANSSKLFGRKLPTDSLFAKLKGKEGSTVSLTIFRKSENKKFTIKLRRETVAIKSVDVAVLINPSLGYLKINRFAETTHDEFVTGLQKLQKEGAKNLVVDLRANGGGYLDSAIEIVDELLRDKELIVVTKNKKGTIDKSIATSNGIFETGKVYVLIDENSASASEILAGAIQDNDRGTIIGRRSFGKGLVQREVDFEDGSAVRLTIARYYTPSGRSIQKKYRNGESKAYFDEFEKRFEDGELYSKDSIKIADTLRFKTKKGRTVYGGGGIMPDIFVPLDSNKSQENFQYVVQSSIIGHFVFEQIDGNRKTFQKLSLQKLLQKLASTEEYSSRFNTYLLKNGVDIGLRQNRLLLKRFLTAEFARQLFDDQKYYELILQDDPMIAKILKLK